MPKVVEVELGKAAFSSITDLISTKLESPIISMLHSVEVALIVNDSKSYVCLGEVVERSQSHVEVKRIPILDPFIAPANGNVMRNRVVFIGSLADVAEFLDKWFFLETDLEEAREKLDDKQTKNRETFLDMELSNLMR